MLLIITIGWSQGGDVTYHHHRKVLGRQRSLPCCVLRHRHCPNQSATPNPSGVHCLMSVCPLLPLTCALTQASPEIPLLTGGSIVAGETMKPKKYARVKNGTKEKGNGSSVQLYRDFYKVAMYPTRQESFSEHFTSFQDVFKHRRTPLLGSMLSLRGSPSAAFQTVPMLVPWTYLVL